MLESTYLSKLRESEENIFEEEWKIKGQDVGRKEKNLRT